MDPNNIPQEITQFINGRYQLWDQAHPNQIWTDNQKNIVRNYLNSLIQLMNEEFHNDELPPEAINGLINHIILLFTHLFNQIQNNPNMNEPFNLETIFNVNNFNEEEIDHFMNEENEEMDIPATLPEPEPVVQQKLRGGKKSNKKRKSNKRRKSNKKRK